MQTNGYGLDSLLAALASGGQPHGNMANAANQYPLLEGLRGIANLSPGNLNLLGPSMAPILTNLFFGGGLPQR